MKNNRIKDLIVIVVKIYVNSTKMDINLINKKKNYY